jgi:hypothetical protein
MNKNSILCALASITLSALVGSAALKAQDSVTVTVPFNFSVGSNSLTAGDYRVTQPVPGILAIHSVTDNSTILAGTIPGGGPRSAQPKLTFQQYGSYYFLSAVSDGTRQWGMPKSREERQLLAKTPSHRSLGILASKGK